MKNKKGFTLLETLLAVVIISMFTGLIITIYLSIRGADGKMVNKRILTAEASDLIDLIHESALDYTIDYEEYFNRRGLGYGVGDMGFTSYGNDGALYYCIDSHLAELNTNLGILKFPYVETANYEDGCLSGGNQKYLEYYYQHYRIDENTCERNGLNSHCNNKNRYQKKGPIAIEPNTGIDYLYLINGDGTERYYFRRINVGEVDIDHDGHTTGKNEQLFKIQILKLKGYDAGSGHDFETRGAYDGFIDTRVCDQAKGYRCMGQEVQDGGNLPLDENDGWIDVTSSRVTVSDMKIDIFPAKDPYLATDEEEFKMDPYAKISFTLNMFGDETNDEITISTTLGFKDSYRRFPVIEYTGYIAEEN